MCFKVFFTSVVKVRYPNIPHGLSDPNIEYETAGNPKINCSKLADVSPLSITKVKIFIKLAASPHI